MPRSAIARSYGEHLMIILRNAGLFCKAAVVTTTFSGV